MKIDVEKIRSDWKNFILYICVMIIGPMFSFGTGYLLEKGTGEIILEVIVSVVSGGAIVLSLAVSSEKDNLLFSNKQHLGRFMVFYLLGLVFVASTMYIPEKIWPFLVLAVALVLLSNLTTGLCAYMHLLLLAVLLNGSSSFVFLAYALSGFVAAVLFKDIDWDYHFVASLCVSLLMLFVLEVAFLVLFEEAPVFLDAYALPLINVFICFICILCFLRYYSYVVVHKYRDKYQEINDTEYRLLTELKEFSKSEYYHAIHTAYFSDKIAREIGADCLLAKAGGYYHKIGKLKGDNVYENIVELSEEHKFPPALRRLLQEYWRKDTSIITREAAIVMFADSVVNSIMYLFAKDSNAVLNYSQIVEVIFKKKMDSGILDKCDLTLQELSLLRKSFVEEKLYYDFLR